MIKWIVKRYLNRKLEDLNYHILSLEQELGYADDNEIEQNEEIKMLQAHKKAIWDRDNLRHVIEKVI